MKILIVNKFLHLNGGSESYIFGIGKKLQSMGHEVQYFGMEHEGRVVGNRAESYTSDMDFHTGKLQKLLYPFKIIYSLEARKKIRAVLEDFKPDAVHLNNFTYQLTPSILYEIRKYEKKGEKIRIVFTAHDPQLVCPNHLLINGATGTPCEQCLSGKFIHCTKGRCIHGSWIKSLLGTMESRLYRSLRTYKMIDKVICPSEFMETKMKANPDLEGRTLMLRNFIDQKQSLEKRSAEKGEYVLYFGRFSEEKGIKTLLKAVVSLPDIPFVFAGSGPLEEQVDEVNNIENRGFLTGTALTDTIENAAFAILPSEWPENCPFTVMESQMLGTPVIGARIGGIPELIREGVDGDLFTSGNVEELTATIRRLWEEKERLQIYTENCKKIHYPSLGEYCEKLLMIYAGKC